MSRHNGKHQNQGNVPKQVKLPQEFIADKNPCAESLVEFILGEHQHSPAILEDSLPSVLVGELVPETQIEIVGLNAGAFMDSTIALSSDLPSFAVESETIQTSPLPPVVDLRQKYQDEEKQAEIERNKPAAKPYTSPFKTATVTFATEFSSFEKEVKYYQGQLLPTVREMIRDGIDIVSDDGSTYLYPSSQIIRAIIPKQ